MALELCTIYKQLSQSQPSPRITSSRTQELLGDATPQDGEEASQRTGSTELSAAKSPWDLNGHLAQSQPLTQPSSPSTSGPLRGTVYVVRLSATRHFQLVALANRKRGYLEPEGSTLCTARITAVEHQRRWKSPLVLSTTSVRGGDHSTTD